MGKKRERGAKDDDGQKKKHKKSKHRKHHKPKLGGGGAGEVVKGVEASPGSRLTLKIKLGNKVIGTSEAFEPDAGSPVESESVRLDSSLGEGEVESMRAESSLGGGEEWAGSDISVGEVEDVPADPVGASDDEAEEEEWLDALETGNLDDRGYLPQKKDSSTLTVRQRAMMLGPGKSQLMQLPLGKAEKEMTEEMLLKKTEKNRKRRLQAQKRKEKRKAETVRRLLEKQSTKKKEDEKPKLPTKPTHPHIHYTSSIVGGVSLSLPHGMDYPLEPQTAKPPPLHTKCSIEGCENLKRYSDSQTQRPLCSLQCYKKLRDLSPRTSDTHKP